MSELPEHYEPTPRAAAAIGAGVWSWMVAHACASAICLGVFCLVGTISPDVALSVWGFSLPVAYGSFRAGRKDASRG
jgi:hypothetical protein